MEFEEQSELERAHEAWSQAWLQAWPRAKTVAMEVEVKVRLFAQPWAEVWTRAEARAQEEAQAWAETRAAWTEETWLWAKDAHTRGKTSVEAKAQARAAAKVEAEALALAGTWVWGEVRRARTKEVPSALADPSTIRRILSSHHRYGLAPRLWHHSRETRDEYSCLIHFIAPITRLPFELLRQIFLIIIAEANGPPLALIFVCKQWYTIVTSIWASLNLGTRTPMDAVTRKLERNQWLLDIVVDTDSDRGDFTPSDGAFEAIFAAMEACSRWRSLVVESFPPQADLPEALVNRGLQRCSNATMSRFTTFKIKSACETSPLLDGLLRILGTTASPELTIVEINSANVILFLAPAYPTMFHSVKVLSLSLDTPAIRNPVDLLPHLYQLETFTASHISFPIYHDDVELPFVRTLRHLSLRGVSIQWMSGRTFHALEHCTLIFPLHLHALHTFRATFPNCKQLTFQGSPLNILNGILAHELIHLSVTCHSSFNGRGNQQLLQLSCQILGESRLAPRILHISIKATNQIWMKALVFMSDLEELVIHSAQPSSLGAKVFQSLVVQPVHTSNRGATSTLGESGAPLCPSLRRFGLKYDRWLRTSEQFDLIPVFASIIQSRQRSNYSLESFGLWTRSDQKDPLELIEGSQMSTNGFRRLAKESRIEGDLLDFTAMGLVKATPKA